MKFNTATKTVESSGEISSKKITLSANAKAFKLLFGQMYPDIIKAIVRELFTNAWDSQKQANNLDTPIEIHIPTKWEPYFGIRDFGVGMTPSLIDDIYSQIFESSKDDSNEEAGMFGMGSKTPLGYTDSFSITSYIDGTFWFYDIYMDETGSPVISLKATGETDEPNGVDVQLAVLEDDFEFFKKHVEYFAIGANTPININREKFIKKMEIAKSGKDWQLYKLDGSEPKAKIRMGCVLYEINTSYISNLYHHEYYGFSKFFNMPFVFDFEIGAFDVTPSREDIVYNKDAISKILLKVKETVAIINEEINDELKNSPSYEDAWRKWTNYTKTGFSPKYPKYGAMKLENYLYEGKLRLPIMVNPVGRAKLKKFEPGGISFNDLYREKGTNYIIVQNINDDIPKINSRIENFVTILQNNGRRDFSRHGYTLNANKLYSLYYAKVKKFSELKRLSVFLPKNAIFVNIADIEPIKKVREKTSKEVHVSKMLKVSRYASGEIYDIKMSGSTISLEKGMYYVASEYSDFNEPVTSIIKALKFFKIDFTKTTIAVIGKSQTHLIKKLDLKDLVGLYKEACIKVDYNDDTYHYHALQNFISQSDYRKSALLRNKDFQSDIFADLKFDDTNVNKDFHEEINDVVISKYEKVFSEYEKKYDNFFKSNRIWQYIDLAKIADKYNEIKDVMKEINA